MALAGGGAGRGGLPLIATAAIGLAGMLIGALGVAMWPVGEMPPAALTHFEVDLANDDGFSGSSRRVLAIAPDGLKLAFTDERRIYLRHFADPELVEVRGTEDGRTPIFSPDSEWIAFCSRNQLLKVPLAGVRRCSWRPSPIAIWAAVGARA